MAEKLQNFRELSLAAIADVFVLTFLSAYNDAELTSQRRKNCVLEQKEFYEKRLVTTRRCREFSLQLTCARSFLLVTSCTAQQIAYTK